MHMVPDVRSSSRGGSSFDFNSQAGVLVVLAAIRASQLSPSERNELRDLVFLYSNGGGDSAIRSVLEERLSEVGITTASAPVKKNAGKLETASAVRPAGFTMGRPVPIFAPTPLVEVKKPVSVV